MKRQYWPIIAALIIFIFDIIFHLSIIRRPFAWSLQLTQPAAMELQQLIFSPVNFVRQLRARNAIITNLQSQNAQLRANLGDLEILRLENEQLKAQLNSQPLSPKAGRQLVARVFGKAELTFIDKGMSNGVKEKDILFVQQVMVGQVVSTDQYFSRVEMIKDGTFQLVGKTSGGTSGLVSTERGRLLLSEVPSNEPLAVDQTVLTVGSAERQVPPDLFLGTVKEIIENPQNPTKMAQLENGLEKLPYTIVEVRGME